MALRKSNRNYDLLAVSPKSRKELLIKFKRLDKVSKNDFYLEILNSVKQLLCDDKFDSLKNLNLLLNNIIINKGNNNLQNYNERGLVKNFNLVALACQNKAVNVLKYLFSKKGKTLYNLSINISENDYLLTDKDEFQHNAFYYAIRSNMVDLLRLLVDNFSKGKNLEQLDDFLSKSYKELKLRRVSLTDEMELFVQSKILDIRFFYENSNKNKSSGHSWHHVQKRIEMVVNDIRFLKSNYWDIELDEKFLLKAEFIAKNIHVLKSLLKSTYNKLPWEEIEFCLVIFIHCFKSRFEVNLVYNIVLNKKKILSHLEIFSIALGSEQINMQSYDFNRLAKPLGRGKSSRDKVVEEIIKNNSSFQDLYTDYETVRNFYSLETIKKCTDLGVSVDATQKEGQLAIIRTLQVLGEHLKNTLESPKLSDDTANILLSFLPFNTREIITNLRDSLSHETEDDTHFTLTIIEKKPHIFFENLQTDISKLCVKINDAIYRIKLNVINEILIEIQLCKHPNEVKYIFESFPFSYDLFSSELQKMMSDNMIKGNIDQLEELLSCLSNSINNKTTHEEILFNKINCLIRKEKENLHSAEKAYVMNMGRLYDIFHSSQISNAEEITAIHSLATSFNKPITPNQLFSRGIKSLLKEVADSVQSRISSKMSDQLYYNTQIFFYFVAFHLEDLKWIKELKGTSNRGKRKKVKNATNLLPSKISLLKEILINNNLEGDSLVTKITFFESNAELQAVIEMLVLDVLSLLEDSCSHNNFFLDSEYLLQIGRNLRNHLAHNNVLNNTLLEKGSMQLLLNAVKIVTETLPKDVWKIDKTILCDSSKLEKVHADDISIINNQKKLFIALEEGDMKTIHDCLNKGADIYGKDLHDSTCLHFSAKAPSIDAIKYVLQQGLDMNSKDFSHQTALHVAAKFNRINIVKYLVEIKRMLVDDCDMVGETPLHAAIKNDSKKTTKFLLKYKTDSATEGALGYSLLHSSISRGNTKVAEILLEREINIDNNLSPDGYTALHIAAERGQVDSVNLLIMKKADIESKNVFDMTPLHLAVDSGHLEVIKTLILKGAKVNSRDITDKTPLHNAALNGYKEIVKLLLDHQAEINASDLFHFTPLSNAALQGHLTVTEILLQNNGLINIDNDFKTNPLHLAARNGHYKLVKLLLSHGASIDRKDENMRTALHCCSNEGHFEIVKILVKRGADIEAKDFQGRTPLHMVVNKGFYEISKFFTSKGADIYSKDASGSTALSESIIHGHDEITKLLLLNEGDVRNEDDIKITSILKSFLKDYTVIVNSFIKKANIDIEDYGYTGLHLSAFLGNLELLKYCFENDTTCSIDARDSSGSTALHMAVLGNHQEIVSFLIDNGAEINIKDANGDTPLLLAAKNNCINITRLLIKKEECISGDRIESLNSAVFAGHHDIVKILLKQCKFDTHALQEEYGLLHKSVKIGHMIVTKVLLENGFKIDACWKEKHSTPLHLAVMHDHFEISKILLSKGADPNIQNEYGFTPLHIAAMRGNTNLVEILLEKKADVFITDSQNRYVIEIAILSIQLDVVKLLVQTENIDVNLRRKHDFTLLHFSALTGSKEITEYLVEKRANIDAKDVYGSKPIHIAIRKGFTNIVEYFLSCNMKIDDLDGNGLTLLHIAADSGEANISELLIKRKANINAFNLNNETPIHLAAANGHKKVIDILLHNGAFYNIRNKMEQTPLHKTKDESIASVLRAVENLFISVKNNDFMDVETQLKTNISEFCFINANCMINYTLLHYASQNGYEKIVETLLKHKANPNVRNKKKFTPLHFAAEYSHFAIVKELLANGAIYDANSNTHKTPFKLATDKNVINLLDFLSNVFTKIRNNDSSVLLDLSSIKEDISIVKAVMKANNLEGNTLLEVALLCNFEKTEELKQLFQADEIHLFELCDTFVSTGKLLEASCEYKKILDKRIEIFGSDNPSVLDVQEILVNVLNTIGNYDESLSLSEEVYQKRKNSLGAYHKNALAAKSLKATTLHLLGKNEEALLIFKEVILKQKQILEPNDLDVLISENGMASVLLKVGNFAEASKISLEVLEKVSKCDIFEKYHKKLELLYCVIQNAKNNLAESLNGLKKHNEALNVFKEIYQLNKTYFNPHHSLTRRALLNIAKTLISLEKFDESLKILRELLDILIVDFPRNNTEILEVEHHIGIVLSNQRKVIPSLRLFLALEQRIEYFSPNDILLISKLQEEINELRLFHKQCGYECLFDRIQNEIKSVDNSKINFAVKHLKCLQYDIKYQYVCGITPLHVAVAFCNKIKINLLLEKGVDVLKATMEGYTALHTATIYGYADIAEIILRHTQQHNRSRLVNLINATTVNSRSTALHVAANVDAVMCLLKHGAIFDFKDTLGQTPLDLAKDEKIVNLLKRIGVIFDSAVKGGDTFLAIKELDPEEALGATNARNSQGHTLLQIASLNKHKDLAKELAKFLKKTTNGL
ncbi:ankyrin-3 [Nephila pilipes]|uniref:Alpha-latrotoxin n=1 Tax=Nephila pilipes TaxID=299642 RepID=A0A8X6UHP2_NEPPI|nr:ankyrin-3 [Nephila pilipes]